MTSTSKLSVSVEWNLRFPLWWQARLPCWVKYSVNWFRAIFSVTLEGTGSSEIGRLLVCIEKSVDRHFSLNFTKFCNKNNWPQCLVVFFIVILRFSEIRNLLSNLTRSEFPLLRVKATYSIVKSLLLEAKKRHWKHVSCPNSSTESYCRVPQATKLWAINGSGNKYLYRSPGHQVTLSANSCSTCKFKINKLYVLSCFVENVIIFLALLNFLEYV